MAALLDLYCFPYAGGSSWIYRELARLLAGRMRLVPVELPGHGTRRTEPLVERWPELTAQLADELAPRLNAPYVFFGYSLGALIALETQRELNQLHAGHYAQALVACAARGPRAIHHQRLMHRMDDVAMFEAVQTLGGIPEAVLQSPELIRLTAPPMRADLCLFETYETGRTPLDLPVHAYYGRNDTSVGEHYLAWQHETLRPLRSRAFDSGHMFLHEAGAALAAALTDDLMPRADIGDASSDAKHAHFHSRPAGLGTPLESTEES